MNEEELKKLLEEHSSSIKSELSKSNELALEMKKDFEEFKASVEEKLDSLEKPNEDDDNTGGESNENNDDASGEGDENEDSKKLEARNNALNLRADSNLGNSSDIATEVAKSVFGENIIAK